MPDETSIPEPTSESQPPLSDVSPIPPSAPPPSVAPEQPSPPGTELAALSIIGEQLRVIELTLRIGFVEVAQALKNLKHADLGPVLSKFDFDPAKHLEAEYDAAGYEETRPKRAKARAAAARKKRKKK